MRWSWEILFVLCLGGCGGAQAPGPTATPVAATSRDALVQACAAGRSESCEELAGDIACQGVGDAGAARSQLRLLSGACPATPQACHVGATLAWAVDGKQVAGIELAEQGCAARDAASCASLAEHWTAAGNGAAADESYRRGCELAPFVCSNWAFEFLKDDASEEDVERARSLFERACKDWPLGCYHLAGLLQMQDAPTPQIMEILARACERDKTACGGLANQYWEGVLVPRDVARAIELARGVCSVKSDMIGCTMLQAASPELFAAAKLTPAPGACRNPVEVWPGPQDQH